MSDPTPVWQARTGSGAAPDMQVYSESTTEDAVLVPHDVAGSVAHVLGLAASGLVDAGEAAVLIDGLQHVAAAHAKGAFVLDPALEDVHMNVEHQLGGTIGDLAAKLHTGRSRNDQVATTTTLYLRHQVASMAGAAVGLSATLCEFAKAHAATPWTATTHGMPAQPATLGFLFAGHAVRFQDLAQRGLELFHRAGECALGSGAVAGSTLPLRPDVTAGVLGLAPPRNALWATSGRDHVVEACQYAATVGAAAASLAQDLLGLFTAGAIALPDGYTTGSSLMPHKRNPDALELARGNGRALQAAPVEAGSIVAGLGLGYDRDLQLVKPVLIGAVTRAVATLTILDDVVGGCTVDDAPLVAGLDAPGITATDVAEALVANGVPFRDAYTAVANALSDDQDAPLGDALAAQGIPPAAVEAAVAASVVDVTRRTTAGGAAPEAVLAALEGLTAASDLLGDAVADATGAAAAPLALLTAEPSTLVKDTLEDA